MRTSKSKKTGKADPFIANIERGLRDAARAARKTARIHGTRIYVWENGKVVALKP